MKPTIITLITFLAVAVSVTEAQENYRAPHYDAEWSKASKHPDRIILNLGEDPAASVGITWRTSVDVTQGFVQYTEATDQPLREQAVSRIPADTETLEALEVDEANLRVNHHSATLAGLSPNTQYMYRVGDGDRWSEWNHFHTAALENEPFSFIYFGDVQNYIHELWSRVAREAYRKAPDAGFVLYTGDMVENGHNDRQWHEWFEAGSWIHRTLPSLLVPGNHEYRPLVKGGNERSLSVHWKPQFTLPDNGPAGLKETAFFTDYQGVRIIGLNCLEQWDEQLVWLDSVLNDNTANWTIVMYHYPMFSGSSGRDNKRMRENLKPILDKHAVDLVLQGHDHVYTRGHDTNNTVYMVSVSGGKMYELRPDWTDYDATRDRVGDNLQLFQVITVAGDQLTLTAYTATGTVYDTFSLNKTSDGVRVLKD